MSTRKEIYACIECGLESLKWMGRCTQCGSWGSFKKVSVPKSDPQGIRKRNKVKVEKILSARRKIYSRLKTGFLEFDRVLGGGLVEGEVVLLGGEPGVGKTTLLLQLLNNVHSPKSKCLYVSSEESLEQLSVHTERLGLSRNWDVICNDDIDAILATLRGRKLALVVIDSVQTINTKDLAGLSGGVGQVRECASRIVNFAKSEGIAVVLIGHITKGGDLAGPKVLEHIVDAVFYLEGDPTNNIRLIRGIKNRFGSTREIGVFSFEQKGFSDVKNPSEIFILSKEPRVGICKGVIFEGRRAILVEVQALITKSTFSLPQRVVSGIKKAKVQMLCALLSKYTKANLLEKDVYVNIANGLKADDSSLDLCICIALLSSYLNKEVDPSKVAIGEVSLTGQVHPTDLLLEKLKALERLGYKDVVVPKEFFLQMKGKKREGNNTGCDSISFLARFL